MENQTMINMSFVTLMIALLGFQIVGDINLEPTHYCAEREIQAFCYKLSSTNKTCYTQIDNGGAKRCSSLWTEIPEEEVIIQDINYGGGKKWLCDQTECTLLE